MEYPGVGTSPWASSPEASRTSFSNDVERSDLPGPAYQQTEDDAAGSASAPNGERQHEQIPPYQTQPGGWSPEQQHQWQQQQARQQQQVPQQHEQQRAPGEEQRRPQSARYHGLPPQQRQHVPQYKLQAKITGLERSGKKDPILKFDVYVCLPKLTRRPTLPADRLSDQPTKVPDNPIPRHPSNTFRVPEASLPPDRLESRSSRTRCAACFHKRRHGHR